MFSAISKAYDTLFLFQEPSINVPLPSGLKFIALKKSAKILECSKVAYFLLKGHYDLVIAHAEAYQSWIAWLVAKVKRKRIILWGENWRDVELHILKSILCIKIGQVILQIRQIIKRVTKNIIFPHTDAIIAIGYKSYNYYREYAETSKVFYASKFVECPPIVSCEGLLMKLTGGLRKKIILYCGRFMKVKGVEFLIEAFSQLESKYSDVFLLIIGDGYLKSDILKLIHYLQIKNIYIQNWLSREELSYFYDKCYVFVQPSVFVDWRYDANGYAIYECMSYGKPIIVTEAVGATPQFVRNNVNGFVVPPASVDALRDALEKLIKNEELAKVMGQKSREIYEKEINFAKHIGAFMNVIECVLSRK